MNRKTTYNLLELFLHNARYAVIATCFLVGFTAQAQLTSGVDTTNIRIGEEIKYTVEVVADSTDLVLFPEGQSFLPLEMIESYKVDTTFEQAKYRLIKKYGLTQFDSGSYTIPPQKIVINERVFSTDSIMIEVADVPVDTTKQKMYEIKPFIEVGSSPFNFLKLLYWLVPLLLIVGVGWYLFRRKKQREAREEQLPPYEEALASLQKLDASNLLKSRRSKDYYSQLTEIVKRYLDREIDDTALESTTDELIERLQLHKDAGHFEFDSETIAKLNSILKRADLVKFAKMEIDQLQASTDRNAVEEIITETHEVVPEPTEEELLMNELYAQEQRRKRRTKRIIYGGAIGVATIIIAGGILSYTYGWDYLKDNIIGHPTKDLVEGQWYRSEYGVPAVIMETPVVLKRKELNLPEATKQEIENNSLFVYGSLVDRFYIVVNTTLYKQPLEGDLEKILESSLAAFEAQGAKNMVVKTESFETEKGIKGLKAYGSFESDNPFVKGNDTQNYEMLVFGQKGALQQVIIASLDSDPYAEQLVDRIRNSIELEVQQPAQQATK
ncbi:DUF4381 domain-containing protein [Pukyongia salina]|uniref:DUF4381 domain-containing protein n=1 Tax=Pukyongia salina TaxID=2094025 RepID=A0A2S0HV19_9FLAO|nr:BatD family protein [Pukyongia salina]AVI50502.1 DUF4381 domain-containing protein [Pukyongia salina]